MHTILKKMLCFTMLLTILLLPLSASGNDKANFEILDDKGSAHAIKTPVWVQSYLAGGNAAVEKLKQYKNKYCFVVLVDDPNKDYAVSRANLTSNIVTDTRNISFSGVIKEADWWQLVLDKKTNEETYRVFVLWTKDKE
ncbi:MAG: hypothetical protein Ta2F_06890 [Termitinemataceae bacterium]|nr:MAG: hypothetical protein Ta2F_06890 [Termitinemataceae bacterium]